MIPWIIPETLSHFISLVLLLDLFCICILNSFSQSVLLVSLPLIIILGNFSIDIRNRPLSSFTSSPHALHPYHHQQLCRYIISLSIKWTGDLTEWRASCYYLYMSPEWLQSGAPTSRNQVFCFKTLQCSLSLWPPLLTFWLTPFSCPPSKILLRHPLWFHYLCTVSHLNSCPHSGYMQSMDYPHAPSFA